MRKLSCIMLAVILLSALALPAFAVEDSVIFTKGSKAEVGGYLELDMAAMMLSDNASSEIYNAILDGNYEIYWYRNGSFYSTQKKVSFTDADAGASYSVEIRFYGDSACTVLWATVQSKAYIIKSNEPPLEIKTQTVFDGAAGMYYSFQFESSDPGAKYSLYRSSLPDGLTLDENGYLSGIPAQPGTYRFTVVASGKGGEDLQDFTLQIGGEMYVTKITTESLPDATVGVAYDFRLSCSDPDAHFSIYYNHGKQNDFGDPGLRFSFGSDGTLSGTPVEAGTYTFWVAAYGTTEDHFKEFTITVLPAPEATQPDPTTPAPGTTAPNAQSQQDDPKGDGGSVSMPWWGIVMITCGCVVLGVVVTLIATKKRG